ncbi:ATP-dependent helicase [Amycolatopsis sp. YIM 10]|uniref:ATP-dependent helicase n=1 Tax=Amycolatopsis sp. YIM 10 TaxID=2653857 RepID=UPI0012903220|nr:ATP-dependent helicase [Amycolatopsis sp. YIM 10]QFU92576.1 Putative ATP-dependent DNA helicase YjcD [Amycolatopsis sp. YIM 10]
MSKLSASIDDLKTNDRQWDAFTTEDHCVVLAPPGSGKTKLLTTRMASDLAHKIRKPQGAACITLTNAAADELRRRIDELGVEDRPNLVIGTVHSFLLRKVVEPFAAVVDRPELASITIASKDERNELLREAIAEAFPNGDTWLVTSTIDKLRQRLASDEDWAKSGDGVTRAARLYEAKLLERRLHDFSGLVATAVDLVENHHVVRQTLTAQFPHLYVDEYQDLAPGLDRVVKALCFDHYTNAELFAVGDPDQALFAFTGTRPELLDDLAARHDVKTVELTRNYRCGAEIIKVANRMRGDRPPIVGDRPGGVVSAVYCPGGLPDQYARVVAAVREACASGVVLHEIAVLCPTRQICVDVRTALREAEIPAFFRDTNEYGVSQVTLFVEAAAAWAAAGREESGHRLGDLLNRWRYLLGPLWTNQHDRDLVAMLIMWADRRDEQATTFLDELEGVGLGQALSQVAMAVDALEAKRMAVAMRLLTLGRLAMRALPRDRVEVTTTTSSKGLEFDVVLIVGADESLMPSYRSKTPEDLAEDRRRFYVSITRARKELRIFYSGFVVTKFNRRIRAGVSRYVKEVGLADPAGAPSTRNV